MAEINIEKKDKNNKPVWPWILGALLVIAIIWVVADVADDPADEIAEQENVVDPGLGEELEPEGASDIDASVESLSFVAYVNDVNIKEQMGLDHEVTSQALRKMGTSLKEISEDNQFEQEINQIEQHASQIQEDPQSLQHADLVNDAFSNAASVLERIQTTRFPDAQDEVQKVQEIAGKIREDQQLLNQKDNVKNFFEEAAKAVEAMKSGVSS